MLMSASAKLMLILVQNKATFNKARKQQNNKATLEIDKLKVKSSEEFCFIKENEFSS